MRLAWALLLRGLRWAPLSLYLPPGYRFHMTFQSFHPLFETAPRDLCPRTLDGCSNSPNPLPGPADSLVSGTEEWLMGGLERGK